MWWKNALTHALRGMQAADAMMAAEAQRHGISKEEAWAGARAAAVIQCSQTFEWLLDLADPLGWRAAARAMA